MITTRFNLVVRLSSSTTRHLTTVELPQVPAAGEQVHIEGRPYLIQNVDWALGDGRLFAYIQVLAPGDYDDESEKRGGA